MSLFRKLGQFELLQDFNENELRTLATFTTEKSFKAGETMIERGDPSIELVFILSGKVKATFDYVDRPSFSTILEAPSLIGEVAFGDQLPRPVIAVAVGDVDIAVFPFDHFEIIKKQDPAFGMKFLTQLLKSLAKKFRSTGKMLEQVLKQGG